MSKDGPNYKDTVNLPRTEFPMKADLVTREPERLARWEAAGLYRRIQDRRKAAGAPRYILHDGPPFANGEVHMGTALNKVIKDLVLKSKTMAGFETPYIPGWDCHGLPIEFKVVREAAGLAPAEIRRRSEAFAREWIDRQRASFRRLGVFGDWENPYLTLSPEYEAAIIRFFAKCVEKDLVYRSQRPVQWSYGAKTALAEAEVEYREKTSPATYVKFPAVSGPLAGRASFVIWTTTPWTLPANLGIMLRAEYIYVAGTFTDATGRAENLLILKSRLEDFTQKTGFVLNPNSAEEFTGSLLKGSVARHPFLPRDSVVLLTEFVTDDTGTGQVHTAPGHGMEDYLAGREAGLDVLSPVDDDGRFTADCGVPELAGMLVFDANERIIAMLQQSGHLLGREDYVHQYPHCWRSKTPVIFRAVSQFFLKIDEIRGRALEEIERVQWLPAWGRNRIAGTVESRPDWCISRQRTWGVPLPVFYHPDGTPVIDADIARRVADLIATHGSNIWFERTDAELCGLLGLPDNWTRGRDTLDVWIDSGCSSIAVTEIHPELGGGVADLYLEATDQHRGWFQSSLMCSVIHRDCAPYLAVLTHGFVTDTSGEKISKSGDKPINASYYYDKYGADIVRLWVSSVDWRDDVPFSDAVFQQTADAYRRIRNTLRILLGNLYDFDPARDEVPDVQLTLLDRWILERLQTVTAECLAAYEALEFRRVFVVLNQFCAVDLSAQYIDMTKDRMYCDAQGSPRRRSAQTAMARVLENLCLLLAPVLAFTADEAWEALGRADSVHEQDFPKPDPAFAGTAATETVAALLRVREVLQRGIEKARKEKTIGSNLEAAVVLTVPPGAVPVDAGTAAEFFIISDLTIREEPGAEIAAAVTRSSNGRCSRCWRHLPDVGSRTDHPDLCSRCADVVSDRKQAV